MGFLEEIVYWARQLWVLWLMLLFLGIVVWAYWPGRRKRMQEHARIPLEDDANEDREK
ncbi:MAG: cbb3-type cytochrome c oxidase subunit 3 [Rhodovibrionaceae bacterium]|nr:cbb3-type cytochrome c oxidase subunit 3 [Rhodovibrionaceae bacterium]